jgi:hypothetical protein
MIPPETVDKTEVASSPFKHPPLASDPLRLLRSVLSRGQRKCSTPFETKVISSLEFRAKRIALTLMIIL